MTMKCSNLNRFHGIAVAHLLSDDSIAFGQVKNSLSGTSLSGNWIFTSSDHEEISSVCRSHILISNSETLRAVEKNSDHSFFFGDFKNLMSSIQSLETNFRAEWESFLEGNPKKAKTLVPPKWANWANPFEIEDPISSLANSGRSAYPDSTPEDMKSLIALARMVRHVLDQWRDLEDSRIARRFLEASKAEPALWPANWEIAEVGPK